MRKLVYLLIAFLFICNTEPYLASSYASYTSAQINHNTGYKIYIDDLADLLTDNEERQLTETMMEISEHGNVAFISLEDNPYYSTSSFAKNYYSDHFGNESGTIFIIDMDERMIWIESNGALKSTITQDYAQTITDNVYRYASKGDYFTCAQTAFSQITSLLGGSHIAQPMKYISNALLAIALALFFNYFLVMGSSYSRKADKQQILNNIYSKTEVLNPSMTLVNRTKKYSPQSSGSSGTRTAGRMAGHAAGRMMSGGRSRGGGHRF